MAYPTFRTYSLSLKPFIPHTHVNICTRTHIHTPACTYSYIYVHAHAHTHKETHAFTSPYTYTGLEQAGLELMIFPLSLSNTEITYVHYHTQPNIVNISVIIQLSV